MKLAKQPAKMPENMFKNMLLSSPSLQFDSRSTCAMFTNYNLLAILFLAKNLYTAHNILYAISKKKVRENKKQTLTFLWIKKNICVQCVKNVFGYHQPMKHNNNNSDECFQLNCLLQSSVYCKFRKWICTCAMNQNGHT